MSATPTAYSVSAYGDMITSQPRMDAYYRALAATVTPGCTVLDIGAGTGIFSLLACQLGAAEVHAVEPDAAITVAEEIARANGFADRIRFHRCLTSRLQLERRADVIVSDLRSVMPLFQQHIPTIVDARQRLLAPGGRLVPGSDELWAAVVSAPGEYRFYRQPWTENPYRLDMRAGHRFAVNSWRQRHFDAAELALPPQRWGTLDYTTVTDSAIDGQLEWRVQSGCEAHGIAAWFDASLAPGIGFSNAPGEPPLIYGQAFFPWESAVVLQPGDTVTLEIGARLVGEDYLWRWNTRIHGAKDGMEARHDFRQTTFKGRPVPPQDLRKQQGSYTPQLDADGRADVFMLSAMDGSQTLDAIARRAAETFPDVFPDADAALVRAGQLAHKFTRD